MASTKFKMDLYSQCYILSQLGCCVTVSAEMLGEAGEMVTGHPVAGSSHDESTNGMDYGFWLSDFKNGSQQSKW